MAFLEELEADLADLTRTIEKYTTRSQEAGEPSGAEDLNLFLEDPDLDNLLDMPDLGELLAGIEEDYKNLFLGETWLPLLP
ncbi:hypothetical protein MSMTP_2290 [Methanosarcina sp. MTP4]|uniref:hypothetical protein n=1 Tax=Methanosarcina sp. MTP4 TaxID=1434100 RepID=UPI000615AE89|nr:hypothetical protein [Methanosarcina sp. MTP4]AKB25759.1 hypothetical protein MSMTP_2290 [Methanosarcina sp. MTP4]